ncbi:nucleotidyltransferase domain-containing protein [Nocardia sp. NPDC059240]|uniref:nucleotidyltransferase domain-containing protein n=1 Tax=Nocardia sp. NPDC059240 TaxID=3346786 RepID=UPI003674CD42
MDLHHMTAESTLAVISALESRGAYPCIGGGWAVDALLGEQTREHSDLDIWLPAAGLDPLIATFSELGIDRLLPWGGDRPWNFVLHDGRALRVDLHLYEELPGGLIHYGSVVGGDRFGSSALCGQGEILGKTVRCETPEWSLQCHLGYPPRAHDFEDMARLSAKFDLHRPEPYGSS